MTQKEVNEIKALIEEAYIQGIHTTQSRESIEEGFHPDFAMLVHTGDSFDKVGLDEWLTRIEAMKAQNPELWGAPTTCDFAFVDLASHAAAVKLEVFKGEVHFSTDYMLLYKLDEGWRIVSKIFSIPPSD